MELSETKSSDIRQSDIIATGLYHRYIKPSSEWMELTAGARRNERALIRRFPAAEDQFRAARLQIALDNPAVPESLVAVKKTDAFSSSVLALRGPFDQGPLRRLAREQARLLSYLSAGAPLPGSAGDVLSLWETANHLEPRVYDDLPAHFRTAADHIPFSDPFFGTGEVRPGMETAAPEEISQLIARWLDWIHRPDLTPELAAFSAHHLFVCIHPFPDGNGHSARLICCGILSRVFSVMTLSAFLRQIWVHGSLVDQSILEDKMRDGNMCPACCDLLRLLIRGQEQILGQASGG